MFRGLMAGALAALILAGCTAESACVFDVELIYSEYTYCKNAWDADECAAASDTTFHEGSSCESLGFTLECSSSSGGPRMFRPGDSCR